MIKKFKKKPVEVEVIQWTNEPNNYVEILEWSKGKIHSASSLIWEKSGQKIDSFTLQVQTLEGVVLAQLGDYLVKGSIVGEFWPVRKDIFEQTYELID